MDTPATTSLNIYGFPLVTKQVRSSKDTCGEGGICTCNCCESDPLKQEPLACSCHTKICQKCKVRKRQRKKDLIALGYTIPATLQAINDEPVPLLMVLDPLIEVSAKNHTSSTLQKGIKLDQNTTKRKKPLTDSPVKRKKKYKSNEQVILESNMDKNMTVWQNETKTKPIIQNIMEGKKQLFFAKCAETFQEIVEGVYILPGYTRDSGKIQKRPVVVTYYDFKWSCNCKHNTSVSLFVGKFCWHEEYCILKIIETLQKFVEELKKMKEGEQDRNGVPTNEEEETSKSTTNAENSNGHSEENTEDMESQNEDAGEDDILNVPEHTDETEESCVGKVVLRKLPEPQKKKPSQFKAFNESIKEMAKQSSRSSRNQTRVEKQKLNLAMAEAAMTELQLPNCHVFIEPLLIPEKILDIRHNQELDIYQYLVKFQKLGNMYNAWLSPSEIRSSRLKQEFEKKRAQETSHKQNYATWYPFGESFAVQWKQFPYFVVSYGAGQFNKFCIVGLDKDKVALKCKDAKHPYNPRHQVHANLVKQLITDNSIPLPKKQSTSTVQKSVSDDPIPKPISKQSVSLFASTEMQAVYTKQITSPTDIPKEFHPTTHPPNCKCVLPDGSLGIYKDATERIPGKANRNCTIWLLYGCALTGRSMYYWRCMQDNPECTIYYDGASDGFLVYSSTTIVSHLIPLDFILHLVTGKGASFAGFVAQKYLMNKLYFQSPELGDFMQRNTFIKIIKVFINLLDEASKPFSCELCGMYPRFLGFDGVSLAMRKKNIDWANVETIHPRSSDTVPLDGVLKQRDRQLLSNPDTRKLLMQFCTASSLMTKSSFEKLVHQLSTELPPLAQVLNQLLLDEQRRKQGTEFFLYCFPKIWKEFLQLIASPTSLVWLIRPAAVPALQHLIETRVYDKMHHEVLANYCPTLAMLFMQLPQGKISDCIAQLLQSIITKIFQTHPSLQLSPFSPTTKEHITVSLNNTNTPPNVSVTTAESDATIVQMQNTICQLQKAPNSFTVNFDTSQLGTAFPIIPEIDSTLSGMKWHWPRLRILPRFEGLDNVKEDSDVQQWADTNTSPTEEDMFCIKEEAHGYAQKEHTAGLFVGSCTHMVGYGFHTMVAPEGRKDNMKVLYERFPPEVLDQMHILYDFNCQEGEYMLNRAPEMCKHVRLFIDRWHSKSHKCAASFKLDTYPAFQDLASTYSESLNFIIQRLHSQTPFMTQETFVVILTGVIGVRNALINKKLLKIVETYK